MVQVHETYGPLITECFKLYDSGRCTIGDVVAHATDQGLRLAANRRLPERPLRVQHMQRILRNRYYTGWVSFGGVAYQGEHRALIDEATFDRVQALLTARNLNKDKSRKRPHHLKGSIFCARCGRRFGICAPTKKRSGVTYPYFYCLGRQNGKNDCPQTYIPLGEVEDAVRAYWAAMRIPAGRVYALRQAILDEFTGKHEQGQAEIAKQRRRIAELEQRRQKAKAAYYADVLDLGEFKTEQETIRQGIQAAEDIMSTWNVELDDIRRSLDKALALVENPQRLYDALPEGLKLVLVQTVFEKVWILDTDVVGSDLTQPFAELLTLEARLALTERRQAATDPAAAPSGEGDTYFRQRATTPTLFNSLAESWERPYVERPRGPLPIDAQNPGPIGGRGSNMQHLVGVRGFKLNHELARYLQEHPVGGEPAAG